MGLEAQATHRCTLVPGDKFRQTVQLVSCEAIVLGIGIWGEKDGCKRFGVVGVLGSDRDPARRHVLLDCRSGHLVSLRVTFVI